MATAIGGDEAAKVTIEPNSLANAKPTMTTTRLQRDLCAAAGTDTAPRLLYVAHDCVLALRCCEHDGQQQPRARPSGTPSVLRVS